MIMSTIRKSKMIEDPSEVKKLVDVKEEDITTSYIMNLFGNFTGKPKYNTYDLIKIPAGSYGATNKKNKKPFTTTIGLWIFNKYFIEKDLFHLFGYISKPISDDLFSDINKTLSYALLEEKITTEQLKIYLQKTQKFMPYVQIFSPNYTEKMLTCTAIINKKKEELYKKYKEQIDAGDEIVGTKMEQELLDFATEYLKNDPSMDMFLSGARGSIGNNFKNMFVMKGVIADPDPNAKQKYHVAMSNYMDGIQPDEFGIFARSLAAGPYARSKKTSLGGYWEKLLLAACQHIVLDPAGSDCGTKRYITVTLTKKNISDYMYSYIIQGSKLTELTSENMGQFVGKTVKMRYSSMCESKTGICSKCMGTLFYRNGKTNVGTATTTIASTLKNRSMKAFHDSVQRMTEMDIDKAFLTE